MRDFTKDIIEDFRRERETQTSIVMKAGLLGFLFFIIVQVIIPAVAFVGVVWAIMMILASYGVI